MANPALLPINLIDNKAAQARADKYMRITIDLKRIIESYRQSLFSFEWLNSEGAIRPREALEDTHRSKYDSVYAAYKSGIPLERPILGIGMLDNIEIGSRRDVLLTLYSLGIIAMDVHIPKACHDDFKPFEC